MNLQSWLYINHTYSPLTVQWVSHFEYSNQLGMAQTLSRHLIDKVDIQISISNPQKSSRQVNNFDYSNQLGMAKKHFRHLVDIVEYWKFNLQSPKIILISKLFWIFKPGGYGKKAFQKPIIDKVEYSKFNLQSPKIISIHFQGSKDIGFLSLHAVLRLKILWERIEILRPLVVECLVASKTYTIIPYSLVIEFWRLRPDLEIEFWIFNQGYSTLLFRYNKPRPSASVDIKNCFFAL